MKKLAMLLPLLLLAGCVAPRIVTPVTTYNVQWISDDGRYTGLFGSENLLDWTEDVTITRYPPITFTVNNPSVYVENIHVAYDEQWGCTNYALVIKVASPNKRFFKSFNRW